MSSGKEAEKLCALKETIAEKYPRQVRHYDASWDVSRQEIVGLEKFEGALLEDILGTIIDECDVGNSDLDEIGESLNIQRSFVEREAENFSGRNIALDVLRNFVESDNKALLLLGNSGCGKTAILAKFAKEEQLKGIRVVSFFAGISRYASSAEFMLKMLTSDLARMLGENTYNLNDAVESELLCDLFYKFCNSLAAETKIVLIIDAVNQLVRTDLMQKFKWLNLYRLSNNVKIIFSCTTDYYQLRYLSALCDNTFTYDNAKHTEESFRKKLSDTFKKMCYRRKWKYVGVWERSPDKTRLHFHGLFYIPPDAMVGELVEVKDYSPVKEKVQTTYQNTYFNERFGRSDFKEVNEHVLSEAVRYIMKYLEKDGGKIVYSRGLPQYFISDIMDDDVACTIGQEDKKLLLFDNFNCWDEGCLVGQVSKEVIDQMPKAN